MKKEKEAWMDLFDGLKFIVYNDYDELEDDLKDEYGEIGTYIINFLFGLVEFLKKKPEVGKRILRELEELKKKWNN